MSQNDYVIANDTAANVRADLNLALAALASTSSGTTEPSVTYANMLWYDTTANLLKMRSEANDVWITLGTLDQGAGTFSPAGVDLVSYGYTSPETTLPTASTVTTLAHGLGAIPTRMSTVMRCKTAEHGYSVGDEAPFQAYQFLTGIEYNAQLTANATNIYITKPAGPNWVLLPRGGGAVVVITTASWKIVVRASL